MRPWDLDAGPARSAGAAIFSVGSLLLLLLAGCHNELSCRPGTLFLELDAGNRAVGADGLLVEVQTAAGVRRDRVAYAGQSTFTLEVAFVNGYPANQSVTVTVTAQQG